MRRTLVLLAALLVLPAQILASYCGCQHEVETDVRAASVPHVAHHHHSHGGRGTHELHHKEVSIPLDHDGPDPAGCECFSPPVVLFHEQATVFASGHDLGAEVGFQFALPWHGFASIPSRLAPDARPPPSFGGVSSASPDALPRLRI